MRGLRSVQHNFDFRKRIPQEQLQFGVQNVWILDPATQSGYGCGPSEWRTASEFEIPNTPIRLVLADVFARMRRSS